MNWLIISLVIIASILIAIGFLSLYILVFAWMIDSYNKTNKENK